MLYSYKLFILHVMKYDESTLIHLIYTHKMTTLQLQEAIQLCYTTLYDNNTYHKSCTQLVAHSIWSCTKHNKYIILLRALTLVLQVSPCLVTM